MNFFNNNTIKIKLLEVFFVDLSIIEKLLFCILLRKNNENEIFDFKKKIKYRLHFC